MSTVIEKRPSKTPTKPPKVCHYYKSLWRHNIEYKIRYCDGYEMLATDYRITSHWPSQCAKRGHLICVVCAELRKHP